MPFMDERPFVRTDRIPGTRHLSRRFVGMLGGIIVLIMLLACVLTLPYTLGSESSSASGVAHRRYEVHSEATLLPPFWAYHALDEQTKVDLITAETGTPPGSWFGTDLLGRSLFIRLLAGGGISMGIGLAAALLAVVIGTLYGTIAGYFGGRLDAVMMRIVDILYGLPYILLVVLLAVAVDGILDRYGTNLSPGMRQVVNVITLLVAIGGVTWLTMARVIRGQVLSLKRQPFMEACVALGVPLHRQFTKHLLPNLLGPIIVYATLTVPSAILSESFLSFLGIGVREPLPSWGNLAAAGLSELNVVRVRWWLLVWPCLFIGLTLMALNFLGEWIREVFDPKRQKT